MSTTSATIASLIYAEDIANLVIAHQYDDAVMAPFARFKSIENAATPTASFPRYTKNAYASIATETTTTASTAFTLTDVNVTVGRFGIVRSVSETAMEDSIMGRMLYTQELAKDAAKLFGELIETDLSALFSTAGTTVGVTNTDLTIATLVGALAAQRVNKAKGGQVIALHDLQLKQLQIAQASTAATTWQNFMTISANNSQYGGVFMNAEVWSSGKPATANASVDRRGAVWTAGNAGNDQFTALAFVMKRAPSSLLQTDIQNDANLWASYARYGFGAVALNFMTSIISKNA